MTRQEPALTPEALAAALADLPGWTAADGWLERRYATDGWRTTMLLVNAIGYLAEAADHHPDLTVRWGEVTVRLQTHTVRDITAKDTALAARIASLAAWRGDEGFPGLQGPAAGWSIR